MLTVFLSSCIIIFIDVQKAEYNLMQRIDLQSRITGANSIESLLLNDVKAVNEVLFALSVEPAIQTATIYNLYNQELAHYHRVNHIKSFQLNDGIFDNLLKVNTPINHNGNQIGLLVISASKQEIYLQLLQNILVVTVISMLTGFVAYLFSTKLQAYISWPIQHMVDVTRLIRQSNDYSIRVQKFYDDELGLLGDSFNLMLENIEKRDRDLENQVNERTAELQTRNMKLAVEMSSRVRIQGELYESEKRFRSTFVSAAIGMMLLDKNWNIIQANKAACNMLGYKDDDLENNSLLQVVYFEDREVSVNKYSKLLDGEIDDFKIEQRYVRKDGEIIWALSTVSGVFDEDGEFLYAIAQALDITQEYRLSKELSYQASHDVLTGLLNRREFEINISRVWEQACNSHDEGIHHILCYIDLDQFKVINDTCGHIAGDEMLRQIAGVLTDNLRNHDHIARLGGDEFGVLIEHCNIDDGIRLADNLRQKIEELQFFWDDNRFKVGASIGLVEINNRSNSVIELLKQADSACFAAKDLGRNRVNVYRPEDENLVQRHGEMQWVSRIQKAIDEDRLILHAQPIVPTNNVSNGLHLEVLLRLQSQNGELIPPGAFLPAAERYGLAIPVDTWVFKNVLKWMQENRMFVEEHINICAINLSGATLSDSSFLDMVIDEISETSIPSHKLCFEITETAVIANLSQASKFIRALRSKQCKFALDDFGSGLSSFAYLKSLEVDYLKIDGMFVRDILRDPIDYGLVRSIHEMGKLMGKITIAEFVENDQILEKIKEIGVDYAQGYGVGELLPLEAVSENYLQNSHNKTKTQLTLVK